MTVQRNLKNIIRARQKKTGEAYAAARVHVMRERANLLGLAAESSSTPPSPPRIDAVVLKVNQRSARVRILGEDGQVTFRSGDAWDCAPGHLVTLVIGRRWTWHGDAYASGRIEAARIDATKLGIEPLPLEGGEFDGIAWGVLPGFGVGENPTCDAADLVDAGDSGGAREILMEALCTDLRCIDAHAQLGNLEFEGSPNRALIHYEIGIRISELSLPAGFEGRLVWGKIYNRPFLRCLHGYGLCLWRLGRFAAAQQVFERILALNPADNQGVRFCREDVRQRRGWDEMQAREEAERVARRASLH